MLSAAPQKRHLARPWLYALFLAVFCFQPRATHSTPLEEKNTLYFQRIDEHYERTYVSPLKTLESSYLSRFPRSVLQSSLETSGLVINSQFCHDAAARQKFLRETLDRLKAPGQDRIPNVPSGMLSYELLRFLGDHLKICVWRGEQRQIDASKKLLGELLLQCTGARTTAEAREKYRQWYTDIFLTINAAYDPKTLSLILERAKDSVDLLFNQLGIQSYEGRIHDQELINYLADLNEKAVLFYESIGNQELPTNVWKNEETQFRRIAQDIQSHFNKEGATPDIQVSVQQGPPPGCQEISFPDNLNTLTKGQKFIIKLWPYTGLQIFQQPSKPASTGKSTKPTKVKNGGVVKRKKPGQNAQSLSGKAPSDKATVQQPKLEKKIPLFPMPILTVPPKHEEFAPTGSISSSTPNGQCTHSSALPSPESTGLRLISQEYLDTNPLIETYFSAQNESQIPEAARLLICEQLYKDEFGAPTAKTLLNPLDDSFQRPPLEYFYYEYQQVIADNFDDKSVHFYSFLSALRKKLTPGRSTGVQRIPDKYYLYAALCMIRDSLRIVARKPIPDTPKDREARQETLNNYEKFFFTVIRCQQKLTEPEVMDPDDNVVIAFNRDYIQTLVDIMMTIMGRKNALKDPDFQVPSVALDNRESRKSLESFITSLKDAVLQFFGNKIHPEEAIPLSGFWSDWIISTYNHDSVLTRSTLEQAIRFNLKRKRGFSSRQCVEHDRYLFAGDCSLWNWTTNQLDFVPGLPKTMPRHPKDDGNDYYVWIRPYAPPLIQFATRSGWNEGYMRRFANCDLGPKEEPKEHPKSSRRLPFFFDDDYDSKLANAYRVLNLPQGCADLKQIRKSYLKLAHENHPDKNKGHEAEATEKFQEVNNAYHFLVDDITLHHPQSE